MTNYGYLDISRLKYLREELDNECIDLMELSELEEAFKTIPDNELRDLRENATASDMIDELEDRLPELQKILYNYIEEHYGENEAKDPCYSIGPMVDYIIKEMK